MCFHACATRCHCFETASVCWSGKHCCAVGIQHASTLYLVEITNHLHQNLMYLKYCSTVPEHVFGIVINSS